MMILLCKARFQHCFVFCCNLVDMGSAFCLQVVTVNDYLARRDSEWVGQVHRFLGLQVGLVQQGLDVRFLTQTSSDSLFLCSASPFGCNNLLYL